MKKWIIDYLSGVLVLLALDYFFEDRIHIVIDLVAPLIITTISTLWSRRTALKENSN